MAMEIGMLDRPPRRQPSAGVNAFTAPPWKGKGKGGGKGKGKFDGMKKAMDVKVPEGYMLLRLCRWCGGRHMDQMCTSTSTRSTSSPPPPP
eukprot:6235616-Heterocapsa_arctica.AAC.1